MSASSAGTLALGLGAVGDVLAGERVLVHLGAHVAGIDDEDAEVGSLDREHAAGVLERGLRRAVAAPSRVRLDRGVGRDVHDGGALVEELAEVLHQRDRRDDVHVEDRAGTSRARSRRASGSGLAPRVLALLTSRRTVPERARRRRASSARCAGSVTSPATPTTRRCGSRGGRPRRRGGRPGGRRRRGPSPGRRAPRRARGRDPGTRR